MRCSDKEEKCMHDEHKNGEEMETSTSNTKEEKINMSYLY